MLPNSNEGAKITKKGERSQVQIHIKRRIYQVCALSKLIKRLYPALNITYIYTLIENN